MRLYATQCFILLYIACLFIDGNRAQIIKYPFIYKSSKFAAFVFLLLTIFFNSLGDSICILHRES